MKNSEYWRKRQEAKYLNAEREVGKFYTDLVKAFNKAKKNIHSVINNFYIRYADNNELTYDVAMQELNFKELQELKDQLKEFRMLAIDSIGEFNLELENMSMKARITRYQALEMQIDGILSNLYSIDYEAYGIEEFINIYKDQYYKTIFNIEQYRGFHSEFAQINIRAVEELINYPFSGASYSDRLWRQKEDLIFKLKDSLMNMIIRGTNPQELSEDFAKYFGTKQHEAYRLLHMEGAFIVEQATLKGYEEDDIEKYEILATLDLKTSGICREQDGKVYNVKEALTGVNSPPFHWFCRTTTMPYIKDDGPGYRMARNPQTDKTMLVPEEMKYQEWYDKYVAKNPKALVEEKKLKDRYSDKKQYKKYKQVLNKEELNSFAEFQELKYNDSNGWGKVQTQYNDRLVVNLLKDNNIEYIEKINDKQYVVKNYNPKLEVMTQHAKDNLRNKSDRIDMTIENAQKFIDNAKIVIYESNRKTVKFISKDGYSALNLRNELVTAVPQKWRNKYNKYIKE